MGLAHRVLRQETLRGASADQVAAARQRALQLEGRIAESHLRLFPEYRWVTRSDCADEEAWHEIRATVALADFDFKEAARLESLPAPRKEAREAWIEEAPTLAEQARRLGMTIEGPDPVKDALERAKARRRAEGSVP